MGNGESRIPKPRLFKYLVLRFQKLIIEFLEERLITPGW